MSASIMNNVLEKKIIFKIFIVLIGSFVIGFSGLFQKAIPAATSSFTIFLAAFISAMVPLFFGMFLYIWYAGCTIQKPSLFYPFFLSLVTISIVYYANWTFLAPFMKSRFSKFTSVYYLDSFFRMAAVSVGVYIYNFIEEKTFPQLYGAVVIFFITFFLFFISLKQDIFSFVIIFCYCIASVTLLLFMFYFFSIRTMYFDNNIFVKIFLISIFSYIQMILDKYLIANKTNDVFFTMLIVCSIYFFFFFNSVRKMRYGYE